MQSMVFFLEIISNMDIDLEITIFLSSLVLFAGMQSVRKSYTENLKRAREKGKGVGEKPVNEEQANEQPDATTRQNAQNARYAQIDKSLQAAFEAQDYWQVLKCWHAMKRFRECPIIHISQIVKSMQCCNQGHHAIVAELRCYFKTYNKKRDICLVNDILEPLARRLDDSELVDLIVGMLPSIHLTKDSRTYEILLTMHVAQQNLAKAQDVIAEMRQNKVAFTPCATAAVMTLALQLSNFDVVLKAFSSLKTSWDIRSTWAVSPFGLERHKQDILSKIVKLARLKGKLAEVLPILEGMTVPQEVMNAVRSEVPMQKTHHDICSDASTSEGSRSDSEVEDEDTGFVAVRPPPGLAPPPGF